MVTKTLPKGRLSDEDLVKMLELIKGATASNSGVDTVGDQQTRTKTALEFFSRQLRDENSNE